MPRIGNSVVATGRGDDGTTGLLYGGDRIQKDDDRTEAYGTIDEAVAVLGIARASLTAAGLDTVAGLILRFQRELFVAAAEMATPPEARHKQVEGRTRVSAEMVAGIDQILRDTEAALELPREFIVPGETRVSAALELARTILRRAERRAVTLARQDDAIRGGSVLPYLNRLADLVWILARAAEQAESRSSTMARVRGPHRTTRSRAKPTQSASPEGSTT